jgi:hypothetical protein
MLTKAEASKTLTTRLMTVANKLVSNHFIIMIVSCVVPLVLILSIVNFVDVEKSGLFWLFILLCPLMHLFMMRKHH